jgi:GWxTD domain-containing protein
MQAKTDDGSWHPVAGYNIPARIDSVAFSVRLTGDTSGAPLQLQARLLRFRADTSIARPYYAPPYRKTSLAYQGIDYGDSTVVHSDRRQWAGPGSVVIQFRFARPRHGNYRFALQASGNAKALYKARDFGVKSPDFPAMHTPRERAGPLVYLMRGKYLHDHPKLLKKIKSPQQALSLLSKDSSYAKLMATSDHDSLRTAVARFWQAHLVKGSKARRVKQLYYRRVETANVLFSGYKAGWKTGRGMAYILFGRPCATDYFRNVDYYPIEPLNARNKDVFIWWYGNCNINCGYRSLPCVGINDHSGTAIHGVAHYRMDFYEPRGKSIYFPFQHFLLERGLRHRTKSHHPRLIKTSKDAITAGLIREVQLQRQLWFSGEILRRKLYWLPPHKQ